MKPTDYFRHILTAMSLLCLLLVSPLFSETIGDYRVVKLSPVSQKAVIISPDNIMKIYSVNDELGSVGKIVEIAAFRVVIKPNSITGRETIIIRLKEGVQRIERIGGMPDPSPTPYLPVTAE